MLSSYSKNTEGKMLRQNNSLTNKQAYEIGGVDQYNSNKNKLNNTYKQQKEEKVEQPVDQEQQQVYQQQVKQPINDVQGSEDNDREYYLKRQNLITAKNMIKWKEIKKKERRQQNNQQLSQGSDFSSKNNYSQQYNNQVPQNNNQQQMQNQNINNQNNNEDEEQNEKKKGGKEKIIVLSIVLVILIVLIVLVLGSVVLHWNVPIISNFLPNTTTQQEDSGKKDMSLTSVDGIRNTLDSYYLDPSTKSETIDDLTVDKIKDVENAIKMLSNSNDDVESLSSEAKTLEYYQTDKLALNALNNSEDCESEDFKNTIDSVSKDISNYSVQGLANTQTDRVGVYQGDINTYESLRDKIKSSTQDNLDKDELTSEINAISYPKNRAYLTQILNEVATQGKVVTDESSFQYTSDDSNADDNGSEETENEDESENEDGSENGEESNSDLSE